MTLLDVRDLRVHSEKSTTAQAELLHGLTFAIAAGGRLGLIGESGSGKSLTALSIMGLLPRELTATGSVTLGDADGTNVTELLGLPERQLSQLRGTRIAMVFQEPMSALDPLMQVGKQLAFAAGSSARVSELLTEVELDPGLARRYPHQLSGGQRQRILIAMALAGEPDLLICDEPTTALDATTQDAVLRVIEKLVAQRGTALLFITHDLRVIQRMCSRIAVMHDGNIVEEGTTSHVLEAPQHPYTAQLIAASRPRERSDSDDAGEVVISLQDVTKTYGRVDAVRGISLEVHRGQRLGLVGGSGSGKTTTLGIIAGLIDPTAGRVHVDGRVQMVFQDPQGSLDPRMPIWKIVAEGVPHGHGLNRTQLRAKVAAALDDVGLGDTADALDRYPHQFSGGQRQRISIARAIIGEPDILLADEAVSALDVSVRAQVLGLLERLVAERGLTLVFISHDLLVVRQLCTDVAIINRGEIVEMGTTEHVWAHPEHDYTKALLGSVRI